MPTYDFSCPKEHVFEEMLPKWDSPNPSCKKCGAPTERLWSLGTRRQGEGQFPYTTTHLSGKPIEVTSPAHERALCKQYGVRKRDDAAFVETEHQVDSRGRSFYKDGRGDSEKGRRWF